MADTFRRMNNGFFIPVVGLRTSDISNEHKHPGDVERSVIDAIDAGYRHFDCAWVYGNEEEVGRAINKKLNEGVIERQQIFVTTKLWNNFHKKTKVVEALLESLKRLNLRYVDLFLMHWPMGFKEHASLVPNGAQDDYSNVDYCETWQGMEQCVDLGYAKSIGVANFNSEQIQRLLEHAKYKPVVNQIEVHLYFNQKPLIQFCREREILVIGYFPFGIQEVSAPLNFPEVPVQWSTDETIYAIANKYKKTPAQVILNYLISLGICIVPRTRSPIRMREYLNIFNFQLEEKDIEYLDSCNKNLRVCPMKAYANHPHYPFERT